MKKLTLFLIAALFAAASVAQTEPVTTKSRTYIRQEGFFIRPEMYGTFGAEFGYQFSPSFQLSGGPAVEVDLNYGDAFLEMLLGVRAYASQTKWTAFFDYHISLFFAEGYAIPLHRFAIGPSYKNLDFGLGIAYSGGNCALVFTLGYHFRLSPARSASAIN